MKTLLLVLLGLAVVLLTGWLLTRKPTAPLPHSALAHGPVPVLHRTPEPGTRHVRPGPPTLFTRPARL